MNMHITREKFTTYVLLNCVSNLQLTARCKSGNLLSFLPQHMSIIYCSRMSIVCFLSLLLNFHTCIGISLNSTWLNWQCNVLVSNAFLFTIPTQVEVLCRRADKAILHIQRKLIDFIQQLDPCFYPLVL